MKIIDMHCDTISELADRGGELWKNSGHLDLKRMQERFLIGIGLPHKGVNKIPATMVSCQVAAASHDSPKVEPKVKGA